MNKERIERKLALSKNKLLPKPITSFQGPYRFLSNFWPAEVAFEGLVFPTVEHAYVAAKTTNINLRKEIQTIPTPGEAKRFGRRFQLRPDWEDVKLEIMEYLIHQKFLSHPDLKAKLLATGNRELIEGNKWHDNFFGSCTCEKCRNTGLNHLGKILIYVRSVL